MDHQGFAAIEFGQEIFGAAGEFSHQAAGEPFGEAGREGAAQVLAPNLRAENGTAFQCGH